MTDVAPESKRPRFFIAILAAVAAFVSIAFVLFGAGGRDDVYMSYWPAYTLATQGKILNYNGQKLEQSPSLLHVLTLGALSKITGHRPDEIGWGFIFVCAALVVFLTGLVAKKLFPSSWTWALALIVLSPPLLYWAVSELEGPLTALTLLLVFVGWCAFLQSGKYLWLFAAAPYLLVRPEATFVLCAACLVIAVQQTHRKRALVMLLSILFLGGALALYRLSWTGYAAPLPAYIKGAFRPFNFLVGFEYLVVYVPVLVFAVFGLVKLAKANQFGLVMLSLVISVIAFTLAAAGDWMEGWRFLVPIAPFLAIGLATLNPLPRVIGGVAQLLALFYLAYSQSTGTPIWARSPADPRFPWAASICRDHGRDLAFSEKINETIAAMLDKKPRVSVATIRMGLTCYRMKVRFGDRVQIVDLVGLCDDMLYRQKLTWSFQHPGLAPPWQAKIMQLRPTSFYNPDEMIRVKHALFNRGALINDVVHAEKPDIIFNVGAGEGYIKDIEWLGYRIAFVDKRDLICGGPLPGQRINSTQTMALRQR